MNRRAKAFEWLRRYGIAECAGIICAFAGSSIVRRVTGNAIAAGYGGAWGEAIGYSSVIIGRDFLAAKRAAETTRRSLRGRDVVGVVTSLIAEFGPSGLLDTFIVRPATMAVGIRVWGPRLGLVAGKLAADLLFYIPVIFMYERVKRRRDRAPNP